MTEAPATITYASVESKETVWIALMVATVNDLVIKLDDILNAYIQTSVMKKVWTTLGPEFSNDVA